MTGQTIKINLKIMGHCVALPWGTKTGSLPLAGGCGPARGVFR